MRIIFFGLGSIGTRHVRLLQEFFHHDLYAFRSSKVGMPNPFGIKEVFIWREVRRISPDVAFITNPTSLHLETAIKCAQMGINLFIEKPIDCSIRQINKLLNIVKTKNLITYVAYCMRFNPIIKQIRKYLSGRSTVHCQVCASSYLPSWRPGRDYRTIYSSWDSQGGGVILDLSHEIDYISYLLGDILEMQGDHGKLSNLKIDSEDYADIFIRCTRGIANLHLDYFSRKPERTLKIVFKNSDYLKADFLSSTLLIDRHGKVKKYKYKIERDYMYLDQLNYFFGNFKNKRMMNNIFEAGKIFRKIIAFKEKR